MAGEARSKAFWAGTHRVIPPEDTFAAVVPHLPRFGVTRLAAVTGLDRIGIPVVFSIRPAARSVAVSAGKGLTLVAAKVSAAMEAIECAQAESCPLPLRLASYAELQMQGEGVIDVGRLAPSPEWTPDTRLLWTAGRELGVTDRTVFVPYELVHAHYADPRLPSEGSFPATTNGLASGNVAEEAICHALCEVIERDALGGFEALDPSRQADRRLELDTVDDPVCRDLLKRLENAGMTVQAWAITSACGIAAFHVVLLDGEEPGHPGTGTGCHPDRAVALCRALTEAAQVRLVYISGSRDDIAWRDYEDAVLEADGRAGHRRASAGVDFRIVPSHRHETHERELESLLAGLEAAGAGKPVMVDLSPNGLPVSVVRVVVPGMGLPRHGEALPATIRVRRL